LSKKSI